jgi:hypothetical protein
MEGLRLQRQATWLGIVEVVENRRKANLIGVALWTDGFSLLLNFVPPVDFLIRLSFEELRRRMLFPGQSGG